MLVDGLDHPECVAYDRASGALWAGGEDGQLYRVDVDAGRAELVARGPGFLLVGGALSLRWFGRLP